MSTQATILYNEFENYTFFTPLPLDKMAAVLTDGIFKSIFLNENDYDSNFTEIYSHESN